MGLGDFDFKRQQSLLVEHKQQLSETLSSLKPNPVPPTMASPALPSVPAIAQAVNASAHVNVSDHRAVQADSPDFFDKLATSPHSLYALVIPELKVIFEFVANREKNESCFANETDAEKSERLEGAYGERVIGNASNGVGRERVEVVDPNEQGDYRAGSRGYKYNKPKVERAIDFQFDSIQKLIQRTLASVERVSVCDEIAVAITLGNLSVPKKTFGKMSPTDFVAAIGIFVDNGRSNMSKEDELNSMCAAYNFVSDDKFARGDGPPVYRNPSLLSDTRKRFKTAKELADASMDGYPPTSKEANRLWFDQESGLRVIFPQTPDLVLSIARLTISWFKNASCLKASLVLADNSYYERVRVTLKSLSPKTFEAAIKSGKLPKSYTKAISSPENLRGLLTDMFSLITTFGSDANARRSVQSDMFIDPKLVAFVNLAKPILVKHKVQLVEVLADAQTIQDSDIQAIVATMVRNNKTQEADQKSLVENRGQPDGLSAGVIAGIVVGSIAGAILLGTGVLYAFKKP